MNFWSIYCPVFAALVSAFAVSEIFQIGVGYYVHKKQEKFRAEFEAKVASGEIDPMQMMFGGGGGMPGFGGPGMMDVPPLPTASGKVDQSHGQYL
jgi:hypothetical protein